MNFKKAFRFVAKNHKVLILAATLVAPGAVRKVAEKVGKVKPR